MWRTELNNATLLFNSDVGRLACGLESEPTFSREPVARPRPLGTKCYTNTGHGLLKERNGSVDLLFLSSPNGRLVFELLVERLACGPLVSFVFKSGCK